MDEIPVVTNLFMVISQTNDPPETGDNGKSLNYNWTRTNETFHEGEEEKNAQTFRVVWLNISSAREILFHCNVDIEFSAPRRY